MAEPKCYKCKNLDVKKKAAGEESGFIYYCKKQKKYVNPVSPGCDKFEDGKRDYYEDKEVLQNGKDYSNDTKPWSFYLIVFIILVILGLILGVFKL